MMADGEKHDKESFERMLKAKKKDEKEEKELLSRPASPTHQAKFLTKINKSLYLDSGESLQDRLEKNKHYRQKGNTEMHKFL